MLKNDIILEVNENTTLMPFLIRNLTHKNRDNIKSLLRNKQVWINEQVISQFDHPLQKGNRVIIKPSRAKDLPQSSFLRIVYEDEHLIVIDKQAGLLAVSDGKNTLTAYGILTEYVKQKSPSNRIFIVHRLDRFTSGLMMFAKSEKIQDLLRNNWKSYITKRTYSAIVEGSVQKSEGRISSYLSENKAQVMHSHKNPSEGKLAVTHYRVLKQYQVFSLLEVNLETGRKNQIRVHMKDIGHPVAGDRKYGAKTDPVGRVCLHASVLAFIHPVTNEPMVFKSAIPADLLQLTGPKPSQ
jgi:23S rRNA pseudouridine1911/1915/1917 synthase